MKKIIFGILALFVCIGFFAKNTIAQSNFPTAIKTCEPFSLEGEATSNSEIFDLSISLTKAKDNGCIYKEKISQGKNYELLTCRFEKGYLPYISESMAKYNQTYAKQIAKNNIFSAKLTSNGEILNKYLVNPKICKITYSKSK